MTKYRILRTEFVAVDKNSEYEQIHLLKKSTSQRTFYQERLSVHQHQIISFIKSLGVPVQRIITQIDLILYRNITEMTPFLLFTLLIRKLFRSILGKCVGGYSTWPRWQKNRRSIVSGAIALLLYYFSSSLKGTVEVSVALVFVVSLPLGGLASWVI